MRRLLGRFVRLSMQDWAMLFLAGQALVAARLAYGRASAQQVVRDLQMRSDARSESPIGGTPGAARVQCLRWALAALGPRMPFRADCVVQVLAAERILLRWGFYPRFYLGVERSTADGFAAHVWLQIGDEVVTGGPIDRMSIMIGDGARQS